jgi:amino acid adenylation domain-containing protein
MNPFLAVQSKQTGDTELGAGRVDLLSDAERDFLLELGNGGPSIESDTCLYELVASRAERSPEAIALVEPGGEITYRQLIQRANGLGRQLRKLGVGPEIRVAILTNRSAESHVGVLGILASGGAYVPLDPSYPDERIAFVLDHASVEILLAPEALAERANSIVQRTAPAPKVVFIGAAPTSERPPYSAVTPANAAYVIYTSGSTGTPKGVIVHHRGAVNLVQSFIARHDFAGHRLLMIPPLIFDASVGDLFPALSVGATIVLHPTPAELGSLELQQFCREFRITAIDAPAALWRRWTEGFATSAENGALLPYLTLMMFGGESVLLEQVSRFALLTGNRVTLANHYGPTEASVCATMLTTRDGSELTGTELPIGRPLPGIRVYVVDEDLRLVPRGIEGELCIGGVGVARGYLGLPELTAERFVRDPFSPDAEARMYRTGDLVRWNADGTLQFIGRFDHQVKIRGLRVELGEIEARLTEHPSVREAVVLAREDQPGDKRLVAYVTTRESSGNGSWPNIDVEVLRTHLSSRIPEYMVPVAYVALEKLPLTVNGKLDRKALPEPDASAYVTRDYEAPLGEAETIIARIWAEVLKRERVGRNDNFFELGGHSLLALTVIERMWEAAMPAEVRAVFEAPTLKDFAKAVNGESSAVVAPPNLIPEGCTKITPEMLSLVSLSQGEIDKIVASAPGGAANVQDIYPLTSLQEGFLFHHLLEKEGDVYLAPTLFSIDCHDNVNRYVEALQTIISRHDILRTAVVWEGLPEPVQVVLRHALLRVEEVELDPAAGDITEQLRVRFDPRHYRLDVRQAPLWQLLIAEDAPNHRWVVLELMHHLIGDHVTLQVMQQEIQMIVQGQEERLPKPLPFRNFVAQARLGVSQKEHEAFFTRMLGNVDEPTAPFGLTNVLGDGSQIVETRYELNAELCQRLRAQARALGVSTASVCHLAWALVLARTSGRDDVVFGTVMFGRMQGGEGSERVMGIFINTLPVRIKIGDEGTRASVRHTHKLLAQLLRHEHAPLLLAQRCSKVRAPAPLFTALLNYRYVGDGEAILVRDAVDLQDDDGTIKTQSSMKLLQGWERTNYPFGLYVNDLGSGFSVDAQVHESIDPQRVCRLMEKALESLVNALEKAPEKAVGSLQVLPEKDRQQVLYGWNATQKEYPQNKCIHELFEQQVRRTPNEIALTFEDESVNYEQLNQRANQLAHYLREKGVKPDERVGICMERGTGMVVALLGALKAGGAYVPLDPEYPDERLQFMIRDSRPVVVLTQGHLHERLMAMSKPSDEKLPVIDLTAAGLPWQRQPATNPERDALTPEHLAYVIYTSGSTGTPKGVMVEHRSVVNRLLWMQDAHELEKVDAVLQKTPFSFDVSVWEFFWPLLTGARLVMARPGGHKDPTYLGETIERNHITTIHFVPSMLQAFLEHGEGSRRSSLRRIICSGEALSGATARRCREALPWTGLHNLYGPTEAAVDVTSWSYPKEAEKVTIVPIGRPIANTQIYILDAQMEPTPFGVAGEIYIGGVQVARGYLNRDELTAERFVRNPFAAQERARMYRTGDLGRWLEDGNIEYLGRNDFQVKIRGFRIELGEIEARLLEYPGVREAVVTARENRPGEQRLVAYFTVVEQAKPSTEELRKHLTGKLPEYMVPAEYVVLEKLPLSANGKLDRKALPAPDEDAFVRRDYEPPNGAVETALARIWAEVLKVERVGRNDNFFELGGHSLLAMTMIERMREAAMPTDVRALFDAPTLKGLAASVGGESGAVEAPPNLIPAGCTAITPEMLPLVRLTQSEIDKIVATVPGGAGNVQDIYPLTPMQEGFLFHHLLEKEGDVYLMTKLLGGSRERLERYAEALHAVIQRHDILRTAIAWEGLREPVQVVWRHAALRVEEVKLDATGGEIAEQLRSRFDPRRYRLDVRQAPMWRLFLAQDAPNNRWVMLELTHHLVDDNTSERFLLGEIETIMAGDVERLAPPLPFRNFVAQARLAVSREEHEAFFTRMLGDVDEAIAPFGLTDVQGDGSQIVEARRELDAGLYEHLRAQALALGVSLASLCHLAWALVLARTSGREDVVFGTVMFGRMQGGKSTDRAMGLFINTLPVRIKVGSEGVRRSVRQTHQLLTQLLRHEHAALGLAQRCSQVRAPAPLFTSLLNYRHIRIEALSADEGAKQTWAGLDFLGDQERTNYPFNLFVNDLGERLSLDAQVDSSVDPQRVCALMQTGLESLVTALEQDPATALCDLDVLPSAERQQVLHGWNDIARDYEKDRCIHELFEVQVRQTPDEIAVTYEGQSLTYGELNRRANLLAHYLRRMGVKPDDRVALCTERSLEMVVAILGIVKAGGAYVPLDPAYPEERLEYMLEDSAPVVLLAHLSADARSRVNSILASAAVPVVDLQADSAAWRYESEADLSADESGLKPHHLAYVIYTSGSTGKPKGVMVEHTNVVRLFSATQDWFHFDRNDVWTLFHSYAFDFSVWEIWGALAYGGKLVIVPHMTTRSPQEFYGLLCEEKVTVLNQTPSAFRQLIAAQGDQGANHYVRYVIFGGEALEVSSLRPWQERELNANTRLINMYGITETTVHVTYCPVESAADTKALHASPIGCRIPDLTIYILDSHQQPVPIGVAGELYVGGAGVARGYLNRAELTAERFLKDPFSIAPRGRMYRTGDVGRFREDGNLEYLGRNDYQVKIRGFRIELGEIEARLAEHPSVGEAVVLAREEQAGDRRLVAYYTAAENFAEETGAEVLRRHLDGKLPEYMVPAAYVRLKKFPLTANGKLDRKALPAPGREAYVGEAYEEPIGEVEARLAEIWKEVLKAERVGRHDNFFALGGDSIRVIGVIARVREHGWACTLQEIFQHQTIASLARAITPISDSEPAESHELPDSLISDADRSLLPEDIEDAYGLSLLQMGMIFHNQLTPQKGTYHDVFSHHLRIQNWDLDTFQIVLDALAQKHPILRTSIALDGFSEPLQLVHRRATIPVKVLDIRGLDDTTQEKMISEWLEEEKETTFDLKRAPLVRVFIHLRGADTLQQTLSFHHAILDGWSVASFQTELFTEYARLRATHEKTLFLKPLATAFKTMVAREKQALGSEEMRSFWRSYLAGDAGSSLSMPQAGGPIEPDGTCELAIPRRLKDELAEIAYQLRVPLRTVLLTAHARVMSTLVGNSDVVTGVLSHGRPQEQDGERILGLFLNTLPFRVTLGPGSWEDLILNVFETEMRVSPFRSYPYFQLFLENDRIPLVEAVFNYVNFHVYDRLRELGAVEMLGIRTFEATNFPLLINVIHQEEELWLALRFDPERLSRNQAEHIRTNYLSALQALAKGPKTAHQLCDCLSAEERQQVLHGWNATRTDYPQDKHIHELFEEQVKRTPQAAAACEDEEVSYDELNARANQLAKHLRTLGVGPDQLVAICMQRGVDLLIALLGVLKAGGAYIPMDPSNPLQRLRDILEDAQPQVLLTQRQLRGLLPQNCSNVILLDEDWDRIAKQSPENLEPETIGLTPSNLAYVIFTSGSTGRPKGVMIEHRSVVNFLRSMREQPGISKDDRLLAVTTVSFDIAALELFLPLTVGAEVVIANNSIAADGGLMSEVIKQRRVTVLQATPTSWRLLLEDEGWRCPRLRALCGGEALPTSLASQMLGRVQELWNLYGPTETTIWSCIQAITGSSAGTGQSESIGRPIANTCTYMLDASFGPVPVGIPGEIYIGGAGCARGYLGNAGLTAERFIPDPFSSEPGNRMYRTGDLGRWRADGTIEYLGRNDFQVKIRGFRIELGEIEKRLAEHQSVREAVVVAREDHPGEKRLVAYVTAADLSKEDVVGTIIDVEALRAHLSSLLPEYMAPAAYVSLPKLPLTPNGKLDRKALPSPDAEAYLKREYEVPVGEREATVARVWAEVLKLDRIGRHDNFFEIGGHSLLVVKVRSLLRQRGIEATVADVFNHPTIKSFAAALGDNSVDTPHRGARRIRAGTQTPLFLLHDAYGDELYFSALAQYLPKDLAVYGLPSTPLDEPGLHTMQAMAERMVNLLQQVQPAGAYRLAGWSFGGVLAYEMAQQLIAQGHAVEFLGLMDAFCPGVNGFGNHQEKTPEAVLIELCEEQRMERSSGLSVTPTFDGRDPNLDFDELFNRYRELQALPQNFEHLSSYEARAQCRNLDIHSRAMEAYRPHSINIPLHLFAASERPAAWPLFTASLGWESCVPAHLIHAQTVPGSHQSMMAPPHVKVLGQRLTKSLAAAATIPDSFHVEQAKAGD